MHEVNQSVVELTQQGNSTEDPVFLWLVCGQFEGEDEVCGVSGGGEGAFPFAGLVQRTHVDIFVDHILLLG